MKVTTQEIYHCEYCPKKQFRKGDMTLHERRCKHNPNNKHKCFDFCKHLLREEEEYQGEDYVGKKTVFKCALTMQRMYSFLAEKRRLPVLSDKDAVRMPLECKSFAYMQGNEDN